VVDYAVQQGWWGGSDAERAAFDFALAYGDHTRCVRRGACDAMRNCICNCHVRFRGYPPPWLKGRPGVRARTGANRLRIMR